MNLGQFGQDLAVSDVAIGALAFVTGFFMTFFGRTMLKVLIFVLGTMAGGALSYLMLPSLMWDWKPFLQPKTYEYALYTLVVLGGLLAGFLAHCFWKTAVFSAGSLGGALVGAWTVTLLPMGFIEQYIQRNHYLTIIGLIGGFVALLLEAYVVIGTSIVVGAVTMTYGLDRFFKLGFANHMMEMTDYDVAALDQLPPAGWALVAACAGFAFCGLLVQCRQYQNNRK